MQEEFGTRVHISDDGTVQIAGPVSEKVLACVQRIKDMTAEVEPGTIYKGRVTSIKEFGAFIEIIPGTDGLLHISEVADYRVKDVRSELNEGDQVLVKVIAF